MFKRLFLFALLVCLGWGGKKIFMPSTTVSTISSVKDSQLMIDVQSLPNDLQRPVWLARDTSHSVVSFGLLFKGSGQVGSDKKGLPQLLASMLDEGSGVLDSQGFKRFLLDKNIEISLRASNDHFVILCRTVRESLSDAFEAVLSMLTAPLFHEKDLDRVKNILSSNLLQQTHDPSFLAQEKYQEVALGPNHPYAIKAVESAKWILSYTAQDLQDLLSKALVTSRLFVAATGHISSEELAHFVNTQLTKLPKGKENDVDKGTLKNLGKTQRFQSPIPQTIIHFYQPGLPRDHPDFYAYELIVEAMGGGGDFDTRLMTELREKRGLCYSCSTRWASSLCINSLSGTTATKTETVDQTIALVRSEWEKLYEKGLTEHEFLFHVSRMIGQYPLGLTSTRAIVSELLNCAQIGLTPAFLNEYSGHLRKLTLEQVNRVIRECIHPDQLSFVVVGALAPESKEVLKSESVL